MHVDVEYTIQTNEIRLRISVELEAKIKRYLELNQKTKDCHGSDKDLLEKTINLGTEVQEELEALTLEKVKHQTVIITSIQIEKWELK